MDSMADQPLSLDSHTTLCPSLSAQLRATLQPLLEPAKAQKLQPNELLPASRSRQALPQELSMLLYSFASLRIRPQPHILDLVLKAASDVDGQMCSQVSSAQTHMCEEV